MAPIAFLMLYLREALLTVLMFLCPIMALAQPGGGLPATSAITSGTINGTTIGATTPSTGAFTALSATSINSTPVGPTTPSTGAFTTLSASISLSGATYGTPTNCSSAAAPAVCGSAAAGSAAVPTGASPTLQINTTAVTANSQIFLNEDESLGTKLGVTCNTSIATLTNPVVTARSAAASFTVQINATIAVNPACVSWLIVN